MQKIRYNILLYTKKREPILVDGVDVLFKSSAIETCKQLEVELLDLKIFSNCVQVSFNANSMFEAKKTIKQIKKNSDKALINIKSSIWSKDYLMTFKTASRR